MLNRYRILSIASLIFIVIQAHGQINTDSPYSRFGIGDLYRNGYGVTKALGGTGIGLRLKNRINYENPAAYTTQDTLSFLFDLGLWGSQVKYSSESQSYRKSNVALSHIAFSFPATKWWFFSVGMLPYSNVGYNVYTTSYNKISPTTGFTTDYNFQGQGDLNNYYLGTAFRTGNLSFGTNLYYTLGTLEYINSVTFPDDPNSYSVTTTKKFVVNDIRFRFGAQYEINLNDKSSLVLGATLDPQTALRAKRSSFTNTSISVSTSAYGEDSVVYDPGITQSIVIPTKLGLGASYSFDNKLKIGLDYTSQDWSKYKFADYKDSLTLAQSVHLGAQYIPNPDAIRGYFNHVDFRMGAYYNKTYLTLRGEHLNDYGMSFGLGLPFLNSRSMFHITYEIGQRGTHKNGLIRENYQYLYLSLTLHDFWFIKAKFD